MLQRIAVILLALTFGAGAAYALDDEQAAQAAKTRQSVLTVMRWNVVPMAGMVKERIPYDEAGFRALLAPLIAGDTPSINFETQHRHKDGHDIPVEIFLQYINPPGETPRYVAIVRDITERVEAEEALRRMNDELEQRVEERTARVREQAEILDQIHDSVVSTDMEGMITGWNKYGSKVIGYILLIRNI